MTDIERAKELLSSGQYTCVLCRGERTITDTQTGIAPMMGLIGAGTDVRGFAVADRIVGRAAALLFVLAGVGEVYAGVMSRGAALELDRHGIAHSCGTLADNIVNRAGTGICPMEQAVTGIDDPRAAYEAIARRLSELRAGAAMRYENTLTSAARFAETGRLEEWVHAYLLSHGNNRPFSEGLRRCERSWFGPLIMPSAWLERCCGPEEGMKFRIDADGFEARVAKLRAAIAAGEDMPPLIINYAAGAFVINDGNHRFEAYQRLGVKECAVIVWTTGPEDAAAFEALLPGLSPVRRAVDG